MSAPDTSILPQATLPTPNVMDLQPLQPEDLGVYVSIDISPEPMYGPDQITKQMQEAVDDLSQTVTKSDSAPRIFEVLQTWEARLIDRGYHNIISDSKGWQFFGAKQGPQGIMGAQNSSKRFPANVYGARKDKISAAIARECPTIKFSPVDPTHAPDTTFAEEAEKYVDIWKQDTDLPGRIEETANYFYTDDRVGWWTRSVADQERWGTETPEEEPAFGNSEPDGVVPETEMGTGASESTRPPGMGLPNPDDSMGSPAADGGELEGDPTGMDSEAPAIAEITDVDGKLEWKVPLVADSFEEMGWVRRSKEINCNIAKERYSWIEDKISAGSGLTTGNDQFDRLARMNCRLAVQNSSVTGESWMSDVTETHTWYRPSQYRQIKDQPTMKLFRSMFPMGLRVTHVGTEFAFMRNESMNDHVKILHSRKGHGQNRRAIGTNYLPLQKILNINLSLLHKYFVGCIPRRFFKEGVVNGEAINAQQSDPSHMTGLELEPGDTIQTVTGIENVPQPTTGLAEFVQWLSTEAPILMDGATDAMFGTEDTDTFGAAKLNRDQALQIFSTPWKEICWAAAGAATQAAMSAAKNRVTAVRSRVPGADRITVEIQKSKGRALGYPESVDIPETLAEQEERIVGLFSLPAPANPLAASIVADPRNLTTLKDIARFAGLVMPGVDAVEKQQGEFEVLLKSGPQPNPAYMQLQQAIQGINKELQKGLAEFKMTQDPNTGQQLEQVQQQLQQLTQQLQQTPPVVTSVAVAQDGSENHAIESAITLAMMNGDEGRKLKNGDDMQRQVYANLELHWQAHEQMKQKLQPIPPIPVKMSATVALDKLPPEVQAQALQAAGLNAKPEDFHAQDLLIPHETIVEKEGVDAQGVPVKTRVAMMKPN